MLSVFILSVAAPSQVVRFDLSCLASLPGGIHAYIVLLSYQMLSLVSNSVIMLVLFG